MRISSYYLKWMAGIAILYIAMLAVAQWDKAQQGVIGELLFMPLAMATRTFPLWSIVVAVLIASVLLGLVYGWLARQFKPAIRHRPGRHERR